MVRIDYRTQNSQFPYKREPQQVRNFFELQKTQLQPDKMEFKSLSLAKNVVHKGANAVIRNGMTKLAQTTDDALGIVLHDTEVKNYVYAITKDGASNCNIVEINRTSGAKTTLESGITGQGDITFCSINDYLYFTNETGKIHIYHRTEGYSFISAINTGSITAYADYDSTVSGTTKVTSTAHGLSSEDSVTISGTTSYNGSFQVTVIDVNSFYIQRAFVADDATGTYTTDDKFLYVTTDGSRLWYVKKLANGQQVLGFSLKYVFGKIISLTGGGDGLDRGGFAETDISKFTALKASGNIIMASSTDIIEFFRIPDFQTNGLSVFTASMPIRLDNSTISNFGIDNNNAVIVVGQNAYIKPIDGTLYKVAMGTNNYKEIQDNLLSFEQFKYDQVAMGYDKRNNLLLISCRKGAANDRIVCFNVLEENFSLFDNVFASKFVQDSNDVIFLGRSNNVYKALVPDTYDDDGLPINVVVRTQMTDFGTLDFYKVLKDLFYNIEFQENNTLTIKVYGDRAVTGAFSSIYTKQVTLTKNVQDFAESVQLWGLGVWGGATFTQDDYLTEVLGTSTKINKTSVRFEIEFTIDSTSFVSIRGIGVSGDITARRSNNLTYN